MDSRTARRKATPAFWLAFVLIISLVFPNGVAQANHGDRGLQVISGENDSSPDTDSNPVGTKHTMTAVLVDPYTDAPSSNPGPDPINVDFELESGPHNNDGNSPTTPELNCNVIAGSSTCVVEYTGINTGTDNWRAWIDHDKNNLTTEADLNEGRRANTEANENPAGSPVPTTPQPGTGCSDLSNEGVPNDAGMAAKSDCTDVVQKTWTQAAEAARPNSLDCDDSGAGADTEREVNPHNAGAQSNETYTCTVYDQFGDQMEGQVVNAEVENEINDPDFGSEGASYGSPDYNCETANVPEEDPIDFSVNNCTITVTQADTEQGKAFICFWLATQDGQAVCSSEPTGEDQAAGPPFGGDGIGTDLADKVEKAWHNDRLNCEMETDINPVGTSHTITCTLDSISTNQAGQTTRRTGQRIDVEASGANDPQNDLDTASSRLSPDFTCTTRTDAPETPENEGGTCTITHGPGGTGSTGTTGTTTYRAWYDIDNSDTTDESDPTEGRDESTQPGNKLEPDDTDVVEKTWTAAVSSLTITPKSDTAAVGSCNAYTITTTASGGAPAQGATIDVEQRHERAQNQTTGDEPTVSFCTPGEGPNPTQVDETKGDLRPPAENPDNVGTAGGETTGSTDSQGKITIGITVTPANGSNGSGRVDLVAFFETTDNDDPDSGEPQDTATKTWVASQARTIECTPESATNTVGTQHVVTCTVRNAAGQAVSGEGVTFTETGPGTVSPTQATTDQSGQAKTTATSTETGQQSITGTITSDTQGAEPGEVDECDRGAGDPSGAPAGSCSDTVTKTWTASSARSIDCEPESGTNEAGTPHVVTCTVRNAAGQPAPGEGVTFSETGPGSISPTQATTDQNGQAKTTATATASESGTQSITGTITSDTQGAEPGEVDECDRTANDPQGAAAGVCADTVEKTWTRADTQCNDGEDNDGDGRIDFPADRGCTSETDNSEASPRGAEACEAEGSGGRNVIIGTDGADVLTGTSGDDLICAAAGNDVVSGLGGRDLILLGAGADNGSAGGGKDSVGGGGGNDTISGGRGNDALKGQGGGDTLKGNAGIDSLTGGGSGDSLQGGDHDDILKGGDGGDTLRGGKGDDSLDGGAGRDECSGNAGNDDVVRCE